MKKTKIEKRIIGRREKVSFPNLGLTDIDAKIDTGAYRSAIHCHNIRTDNNTVRFNLLDPLHEDYNEKEFVMPVFKLKNTTNHPPRKQTGSRCEFLMTDYK